SADPVSLAMATHLELAHATASADLAPRLTVAEEVAKFVRTKPLGAIGAAIILGMLGLALFAGLLAPYDPYNGDYGQQFARPSARRARGAGRRPVRQGERLRRGRAGAGRLAAPRHPAAHPPERRGALHHHADRAARGRDPGRGGPVLPGTRRRRADAVLGADALRLGALVRRQGAVDRALPGHRDRPRRVRLQPLRRLAARRARPQVAGAVSPGGSRRRRAYFLPSSA